MEKLAIGRALQRQGHPKRAMQSFLDGLAFAQSNNGDEVGYWLAIANLEHEAGEYATALALHQRALTLARCDKQQCSARLGLAADLWAMGEEKTALVLQQAALSFAGLSDDAVLLEESARLYRLQNQWQLALQQYTVAISAVTEADALALHLAILEVHLQLSTITGLAAAVEQAKQALALSTANHLHEALLLALAQCCERLEQYAAAAEYYQAAIALQTEQKKVTKAPRRLLGIELKLQQTISEIEIDVLRHKNAQQNEQVQRLESATYRDTLTGLHNLRYLQARWEDVLAQAQQTRALCVIHMGVDQSTHLRDVMGDEVANESVLRIANVLRRCCPVDGVLVAANNSEFRLLLPLADKAPVQHLIDMIQREVALLDCAQLPEPLTVSFGCTAFQAGDHIDVLQLRADLALYLAMRRGAGAVVWEEQV